MTKIVENQLASEKWRVLYPKDDLSRGDVDVLKRSAILKELLKRSLSDAYIARKRVAKDKLLKSPGYFRLCSHSQGLSIMTKWRMAAERQSARDRF